MKKVCLFITSSILSLTAIAQDYTTVSTTAPQKIVLDTVMPASVPNSSEKVMVDVEKVKDAQFASFEGINGGELYFKLLSNDELISIENFKTDELKMQMMALNKSNVSEVYKIVYRNKLKEKDSKQLMADGVQTETIYGKEFELISAEKFEK